VNILLNLDSQNVIAFDDEIDNIDGYKEHNIRCVQVIDNNIKEAWKKRE
jgi:hypothetical protein